MLGPRGSRRLDDDSVEGEDPLAPFGPNAARHVRRTDGFPHCPDIVVNSTFWEDLDEVAAFEELVGSHGGMGGEQSHPFALIPSRLDASRGRDRGRRGDAPPLPSAGSRRSATTLSNDAGAVTWLGHATALIELGGARLLTDPVLRRHLFHLKRVAPPVDPEHHSRLDAVLISHLHHDHLDLPSLRLLAGTAPGFSSPPGPDGSRAGMGSRRSPSSRPATRTASQAHAVLAVPAIHHGGRVLSRTKADCLGYVVEADGVRVYFAGDTDVFDGMADLADLDLALIPVWGWGPEPRIRPPRSRGRGRGAGAAPPAARGADPLGHAVPAHRARPEAAAQRSTPRACPRGGAARAGRGDPRVLAPGEAIDL